MQAGQANAAGSGTVGRKAEPAGIQAGQAVLRMVVEITRADTGKKETVELIGTPIPKEK